MKKELRIVDCCASCEFVEDHVPGMQCEENNAYFEEIGAYCVCDLFQRHPEVRDDWDLPVIHDEENDECHFFRNHHGDYIKTYCRGVTDQFTVEELYQAFKKRLLGEIKEGINGQKARSIL